MDNLYLGIITIIICLIGYTIAFRQYNKGRVTIAIALLIVSGFILRFYAATDLFLHAWDERYHALVAKNLIDHPFVPMLYKDALLPYDYRGWGSNYIWVHKQPLPLWTMAMSMSVFGVNEIALRLPSVILTTLGIAIIFFIAKYFYNNRVAIISAFLYSIHGLIIELSAGRIPTDHIDIFFLFFIQLSVLLVIRYVQTKSSLFNILCGISIGFAILSKWLPALIILPVWWFLALDSKRFSYRELVINFSILCLFISVVSLPWQIYIHWRFPLEAAWESAYNRKHIFEALQGHANHLFYHFDHLRITYGELIYIPIIWFLVKTFQKPFNFKRLALVTWIIIPYIFFSLVQTKMKAYTLFTAPAIFIITAYFWDFLYRYRNKFRFNWLPLVFLFLLIGLPIRYSIERIKPFSQRERNPVWAQELRELGQRLDASEKSVIFNSEYPIETMFYTSAIAYYKMPDDEKLSEIKSRGYKIYIRKDLSKMKASVPRNKDKILTFNDIYYLEWK